MKLEGVLKPHASSFKLLSITFYASGAGGGVQEQVSRKGAICFPAVFLSDPAAIAWRDSHMSTCLSEKEVQVVKECMGNPGPPAKRTRKGGGLA